MSHFVQILDFIPQMFDAEGRRREPSELKRIRFEHGEDKDCFLSVLNSTLFYWLLTVFSDCRNLNKREVESVRFDRAGATAGTVLKLVRLASDLMQDIRAHSRMLTMSYKKHGCMQIQCTYPRFSKHIIDEIDGVLALHFGLTPDELDLLINYDIKYRMGQEETEDE